MLKARSLILKRVFATRPANFGILSRLTGKESKLGEAEACRYVNGSLVPISNLVLHQKDSIEQYVLKIVKDYYRTTYKSGLTLESSLADHGLDSLDAMELAMQIEEDLGYKIAAENLTIFHKVKHYVNFIQQVESFKTTYNKDPLA